MLMDRPKPRWNGPSTDPAERVGFGTDGAAGTDMPRSGFGSVVKPERVEASVRDALTLLFGAVAIDVRSMAGEPEQLPYSSDRDVL